MLEKFWEKIYVPEAVWKEVVIDGEEIPNLKQEIEKLKIKADFWLKDSLIQDVLKEAGEIPY